MTQEQASVKDWMKSVGQECPEKPTIPSLEVRRLRAKLILEEALETIKALGICISLQNPDDEWERLEDIIAWNHPATFDEEQDFNIQLKDIADGCSDLKVVTEGTLVACGLVRDNAMYGDEGQVLIEGTDPLFREVMRSNHSKLWNSEDLDKEYPRGLPEGWSAQIVAEHPELDNVYAILVKNQDGKVIKSPSYSPANLQPIIDEMSR